MGVMSENSDTYCSVWPSASRTALTVSIWAYSSPFLRRFQTSPDQLPVAASSDHMAA